MLSCVTEVLANAHLLSTSERERFLQQAVVKTKNCKFLEKNTTHRLTIVIGAGLSRSSLLLRGFGLDSAVCFASSSSSFGHVSAADATSPTPSSNVATAEAKPLRDGGGIASIRPRKRCCGGVVHNGLLRPRHKDILAAAEVAARCCW